MEREPNTLYVASLSYGKDSIAMIEAIKQLGYPLDGIVHAEVWATDTIPADLPPMVDFKAEADKKIKEMYGLDVIHTCAMRKVGEGGGKLSYERMFYRTIPKGKHIGEIKGFPTTIGAWCNSRLKKNALRESNIREIVLSYTQQEEGGYLQGTIKGFPNANGKLTWCNDLKKTPLRAGGYHWIPRRNQSMQFGTQTASPTDFQYTKGIGVPNSNYGVF